MAQPIFYQTLNMLGIDPTLYYTNLATAGASVTPEYPAPPFITGTRAFGSDGSEFIFVQASTSIGLSDFVVITAGTSPAPFLANSITTANAGTSATGVDMAIASTGLIVKQSVTVIPAGAMFWALTKGNFVPATTSGLGANGIAASTVNGVVLYTTTTAGQMSTTVGTASSVGSVAFGGFNVVSSISISIANSVVPPVGTLSNGFTVGPVVSMNNPRTIIVNANALASLASAVVYW